MAKQAKILSFDDAKRNATRSQRAARPSRANSSRFADFDYDAEFRETNLFEAQEKPRSAVRSVRFEDARRDARSGARGTERVGSRGTERVVMRGTERSQACAYEQDCEDTHEAEQHQGKHTAQKSGLVSRLQGLKKQRAKAKAGKEFTRQFGGSSAPAGADDGGPRAAVYKGQMGTSQRRANRMQGIGPSAASVRGARGLGGAKRGKHSKEAGGLTAAVGSAGVNFSIGGFFKGLGNLVFGSRKRTVVFSVLACIALVGVFMYPAAKQYYVESRHLQQVRAEYEAVMERNNELTEQRDFLLSDAGIEQTARENYGWVTEGENAVLVYGLEADNSVNRGTLYVASGSVPAPTTWYSVFLDPLFGYSG